MVRKGMPMVASSGFVSEIDADLCTVCGECGDTCPFGALTTDGTSVHRDWDRCMGCGVCETACPTGAIRMERDENKGIPLDVTALS